MIKKEKKCKYCGKSRFRQSTEQKDGVWISKKICEFCGKVVDTRNLK
jgi:hypothetical protein